MLVAIYSVTVLASLPMPKLANRASLLSVPSASILNASAAVDAVGENLYVVNFI